MKIFISWSGQLSKELGEVINNWIPGVLQNVKPYFTPDDVEKGTRWNSEISRELQESQVGILILTKDNLTSPWIMFESGALSKQMDKSRICPILFGIENTDLVGPLVQFQATAFNKTDVNKLVKTINNACVDYKLEDSVLNSVYEMWWPKLEENINVVMRKPKEKTSAKIRTERDMIEEILSLARISVSRTRFESGIDINISAVDDLILGYRKLRHGYESHDNKNIEQALDQLRRPIEFIAERRFHSFEERPRIIEERPNIIKKSQRIPKDKFVEIMREEPEEDELT